MAKTNLQKWIAFMKKTPPQVVPPMTSDEDAGKVLSVDPNGNPTWITPPAGLPPVTEQDVSKVLVTDSGGTPSWGTVVGGEIALGADEGLMIYKLPSDNT